MTSPYTVIDGIKCYNPEVAESYDDYPDEGFALTDQLEAKSFWCQSRSRILDAIIQKYAKPSGKTRFLEVGCATGGFIRTLMQRDNIDITGSEIYINGLKYAKKNLPGVEFIQFDATKESINETFDMIGAFDVIEHIEEDEKAIANIYRLLNDGGHFVVTVPQYMFLWSRLDEIVMHKRRYSSKELVQKLEKAGFTIRFNSSFLFMLFPLMVLTRLRDRVSKKPDLAEQPKSQSEFQDRVEFPPLLNWIFDKFMRIDEALIKLGIPLPFGGSLLVVAQKKPR